MDQLTDKQKDALEKLKKEVFRRAIGIGFRGALRVAAMCFIVIAVNQLFVQRDEFVFLMAMVSGIFALQLTIDQMNEQKEIIREKVKLILNDK